MRKKMLLLIIPILGFLPLAHSTNSGIWFTAWENNIHATTGEPYTSDVIAQSGTAQSVTVQVLYGDGTIGQWNIQGLLDGPCPGYSQCWQFTVHWTHIWNSPGVFQTSVNLASTNDQSAWYGMTETVTVTTLYTGGGLCCRRPI